MEKYSEFDIYNVDKCINNIAINCISKYYNRASQSNEKFIKRIKKELKSVKDICEDSMHLSDIFSDSLKSLGRSTSEIQKENELIDKFNKEINHSLNESSNVRQLSFQSVNSIISSLPSSCTLSQKYDQCCSSVSELNSSISSIFSKIEKVYTKNKKELSTTVESLNETADKLNKLTKEMGSSFENQHNLVSIQDTNVMKKFGKDIDKLNNDIEEYNRQKADYDKEKEKMVEEYKDVIREIMEYNAKKILLDEISKGFDNVVGKLDEMKKKLKKDRKDVEDLNQFQVILNESNDYIEKHTILPTGKAMITNAGNLPCSKVIHAVGPDNYKKNPKDSKKKMKEVVESILNVMIENNIESVAIPGISSGIFGYPLDKAATVICKTTMLFILQNKSEMEGKQIVFCNIDDDTTNVFFETAQEIFNPQSEDEHSPSPKEKKRCSECGHKIKDREHQSKGKHLDLCFNCYSEKKKSSKSKNREKSKHKQKEKDNKESEDEDANDESKNNSDDESKNNSDNESKQDIEDEDNSREVKISRKSKHKKIKGDTIDKSDKIEK